MSTSQIEPKGPKILGLGGCFIDLLAVVAEFPKTDSKIRTKSLVTQGGGNTANSLTGISRLGLSCSLIGKIGDDANGREILKELQKDEIETKFILTEGKMTTAFTYIIVDEQTSSRTCIHTPAKHEVYPEDIEIQVTQGNLLDDVSLLLMDTRHTKAAVFLAEQCQKNNIPIVLDVERDRPGLNALLPLATVLVTNSTFPLSLFPDEETHVNALVKLIQISDHIEMVITTLGEKGSLLLMKENNSKAKFLKSRNSAGCDSSKLTIKTTTKILQSNNSEEEAETKFLVMECPAFPVENVVDTTGAGDGFVAGIAYGIATGLDIETMLNLATTISSLNIQQQGARKGLPDRALIESKGLLN